MLQVSLVGFLKTSALWGLKSEKQTYEEKKKGERIFCPCLLTTKAEEAGRENRYILVLLECEVSGDYGASGFEAA